MLGFRKPNPNLLVNVLCYRSTCWNLTRFRKPVVLRPNSAPFPSSFMTTTTTSSSRNTATWSWRTAGVYESCFSCTWWEPLAQLNSTGTTSSPNSHICTDLGPSFGFVVNIFLNFCIGVTIMCILLHITKCEKIFSDALKHLWTSIKSWCKSFKIKKWGLLDCLFK